MFETADIPSAQSFGGSMRKAALIAASFISLFFASDVALASLSITPPQSNAVAAPAAASDADKAKNAEADAALQAKRNADARKREQARIAAAALKRKRGEARIAAQARMASLPAQRAGANAQQAKTAPRMDRAALWAKCDATLSRGNRDDDIARPGRVEACVRDGGPS